MMGAAWCLQPLFLPPLHSCTVAELGQGLDRTIETSAQELQAATLLVIDESTVYPGATEEVCVPILEGTSGLSFNQGFVCGYSPARINPVDREHRLTSIVKVTSGSTLAAAAWIDAFCGSIMAAGSHPALAVRS